MFEKVKQKLVGVLDKKLLIPELYHELIGMDEVELQKQAEKIVMTHHFNKTEENGKKLYTCRRVLDHRGLTPQYLLDVRDANEVAEELTKEAE